MRARAKGRDTKLVWDAHEFLPGIKPWNSHPRWHIAQQAHEREYARQADAVITVSEDLANLLVSEHGLATRPTVVLNAPDVRVGTTATKGRSARVLRYCVGDSVTGLQRHGCPTARAGHHG